MIIHCIIKEKPQPIFPLVVTEEPTQRFRGVFGTEEHKRYIYERLRGKFDFDYWDDVEYKGKPGMICDILTFDMCLWEGLKCKFLEVWLEDNSNVIVHPSEIRKLIV
jgi:hypothetical protein